MAKVLVKQNDKEWEQRMNELKQEHKAEVVKLKVELKAQKILTERAQDDAKVRNGFDTKERALLKEIRDLKNERDGLSRERDEARDTIKFNFEANKEQRAALRQAQQDLVEFEAMKTELIRLQRSINERTEVRDAIAKLKEEQRKMQKACNDRVRHMQARLNAANEKLEDAEQTIKDLREEEDGGEEAVEMDD